jgi:hypothetical protein
MWNRLQENAAIDHGTSKVERLLRTNRFKIALLFLLAEILVIHFGGLGLWFALVIGGCLLAAYLLWHKQLHGTPSALAWIVAASQAVGVLVFVLALVAAVIVVAALIVLAVVTLAALLVERR